MDFRSAADRRRGSRWAASFLPEHGLPRRCSPPCCLATASTLRDWVTFQEGGHSRQTHFSKTSVSRAGWERLCLSREMTVSFTGRTFCSARMGWYREKRGKTLRESFILFYYDFFPFYLRSNMTITSCIESTNLKCTAWWFFTFVHVHGTAFRARY